MNSHVLTTNTGSFSQDVLKSELPVLVDFSATWCGPCKLLEPIVSELAENYQGRARVVKIDIDSSPELATSFGVTAVPTLLFFKGGEVVDQAIGLMPGPTLNQKLERLVA
ncbi:MAG: thioredoxin [Gemmatimonadales bacterium]|jgi:thioredoxin 1|nr:thioredoxin [Gemmatimonadales bacterium]